ncbi:MAG: hypothetical protein J6N21_16325 [Butyrivibrio sp.]|nr:hypothetical protein [Butyrivibrio sp.]
MNDIENARKQKQCDEYVKRLCHYECPLSKESLYYMDMLPVEVWLPMMNKEEVKKLISECSKEDLINSLGVMSKHCIKKIFDAIEEVDEKIDLCCKVRPFTLELIAVDNGLLTMAELNNDFEINIRPSVNRLSEIIRKILFYNDKKEG